MKNEIFEPVDWSELSTNPKTKDLMVVLDSQSGDFILVRKIITLE